MSEPVILVPLDGSAHALAALPVARWFAEAEGATLHILHVAEPQLPSSALVERLGLDPAELRGSTLDAHAGEPASSVLNAARETAARLIVMCTHTASAMPRRVLGHTALGILRGAPCPVVLVRPERGQQDWRLRRILLPHDGTPAASAALRPAAELAHRTGAELVVLHVAASGTAAPSQRGALTAPYYLDQPQHEWPAWTSEFLERLACVCPLDRLRVRLLLAEGSPGSEIARTASAQAADLVVLAWGGKWSAQRAATLKGVMRQSPCPLMVVRS